MLRCAVSLVREACSAGLHETEPRLQLHVSVPAVLQPISEPCLPAVKHSLL